MPLRALRLIATSISTEATSLSFTDTLQLAAGRAWSRRVSTHSRQNIPPRKRATCSTAQPQYPTEAVSHSGPSTPKPVASFSKKQDVGTQSLVTRTDQEKIMLNPLYSEPPETDCLTNAVHFDPEVLTSEVYETQPPQDCRDNPVYHDIFQLIPTNVMPFVLITARKSDSRLGKSPAIPAPTSQRSLHRNLLFLLQTRKPPPSLPVLLDYHNLYPQWHSTRSSNLLIQLGLRNHQFGLVRRLLTSFRENGLERNMETYQLEIRWLILQGKWDEAWNYANRVKKEISHDGHLPLPIWIEFCRPHHVSPRKQAVSNVNEDPISGQEQQTDSKLFRTRLELLRRHMPPSMPPLSSSSPFLVHSIIQLMIKSDYRDDAMTLVQNYFKVIPSNLDTRTADECLNIIHTFMTSTGRTGLPGFYESRRILMSFLEFNSSLKPTSRTLHILLLPLFRAKRCGTIAWEALQSFKAQWGPRVDDRRVQLRVSQLALKEGRIDIVKKISQMEGLDRTSRQRQLEEQKVTETLELSSISPCSRSPLRRVYSGNGRQARLWFRHRVRVIRKLRNKRRASKKGSPVI